MKRSTLDLLHEWFAGFCSAFHLSDEEEQRNIRLKEAHTCHVRANMVEIASAQFLEEGQMVLAEAIALFHDIGRFPQYGRYRTFSDAASVNHGVLGAEMLSRGGVLDKLPRNEQVVVTDALQYHNAFAVPAELDTESDFYVRLVRDADKLDIWRVFLEFYGLPEDQRASAVSLGFPDVAGCSADVLGALGRGELVRLTSVKSLNDFKLLQLSWVYDLNFEASVRLVLERDYLQALAATLPATDEVHQAVEAVREFATRAVQREDGQRRRAYQ